MHKSQPLNESENKPQEANVTQRQTEQTHQSPQGKKGSIQAKQRPVQRKQGYQAHQAKHQPVQRQKAQANDLKTQMGNQHGVDLSGFKEHQNSSFPGSVNALATIQGKNIHYAPGQFTEQNRKHELGHAIDNTLNGTPKGDKVVNGQSVDTTREKAADKIAETPLQRTESSKTIGKPQSNETTVQRKEADELLGELRQSDEASQSACYAVADFVFQQSAVTHPFEGEGMLSLTKSLEKFADEDENLVMYRVNLNEVIGHHLCIMQRGANVMILQGWIDSFSLGEWLQSSAKWQNFAMVASNLKRLVSSKWNRDENEDEIRTLISYLFGLPKNDKKTTIALMNLDRKRGQDGAVWQAGYMKGQPRAEAEQAGCNIM